MHASVSNQNLLKLKELSDKICLNEGNISIENAENANLVEEIEKTINSESSVLSNQSTTDEKLNCYEKMFQKLQIMINNFKFPKNE
jgi:hypothetical protein